MKIAILSSGTRGDVQPYIALGKALQGRGHDVVLTCPENFESWVTGHGLAFHSIGVDMQAFIQEPEGKQLLSGNVFTLVKIWKSTIVPLVQETLDAIWESARDADVIVFHPKAMGAVDVAQATGAALVSAIPFPMFPTKAFPLIMFRGNYGPWLNRLTYKTLIFSRLFFRGMLNRWRKDSLGLGKSPRFKSFEGSTGNSFRQLCMVSSALVEYDSGDNVDTTGYWFLEEGRDWQPDPALAEFLGAGEKPIYIGFGSMPAKNPGKLTREIIDAVQRAGVRTVLAAGWGGIGEMALPETIHAIDGAPHDALFTHVRAVVHHGGAGTTAAGLRAGLPTLICPMAFDQPWWGRRIHALGCGPKPLAIKRIGASRLARRLVDLTTNESYKSRAEEIARNIANEDGIARAVGLIEGARNNGQGF